MKAFLKKYYWILLVVLVAIQFVRIDKSNPEIIATNDLITMTQAPADIANILKVACYDCHSNETTYPWYTNVAPISWWIKKHIDAGRNKVNYSEWGSYAAHQRKTKLEESYEITERGDMPIIFYKAVHTDAWISQEQRSALVEWLKMEADKVTMN